MDTEVAITGTGFGGLGINSSPWPDFTWRFRRRVSRFDPARYRMIPAHAGGAS